ncbi:maleylpyruvate isomerase family mycothiol-dependent enzyme [Tessaracoccus sp. MC1865]|uniref:maleylpyruvate isomerase family mycothiol-dependent enzyme n=1 Tax=Tessaracoccus sp. MC1865 TaxID=2760310 RepID=UPI0015FEE406|nr:maleylpyruvate isomerase family mycothiol-dependent enzyme [Tessaracoccus sp. MC1865]MBB1482621.1 maleylpyruvate isomerase family mycothiol-dependent enzyme [Tessaracoccus sp. MC1865]
MPVQGRDDLSDALAELRLRQGQGARADSDAAPHDALRWARVGTAYFARLLRSLRDADLAQPSLLPGWSRAHVVAHVGYNARALARLCEWAETGVETPMYSSPEARNHEIDRGATLPSRALRHLFDHSAVHLNVMWRDLADAAWERPVRTARGRQVPVTETAFMRAREVWVHAVDLDNGGSFLDFPTDFLEALLRDVIDSWERRGPEPAFTLQLQETGRTFTIGSGEGPIVSGTLPDAVRWMTGRGDRRLAAAGGALPTLPEWL